jgi:hypothetical protein
VKRGVGWVVNSLLALKKGTFVGARGGIVDYLQHLLQGRSQTEGL